MFNSKYERFVEDYNRAKESKDTNSINNAVIIFMNSLDDSEVESIINKANEYMKSYDKLRGEVRVKGVDGDVEKELEKLEEVYLYTSQLKHFTNNARNTFAKLNMPKRMV